MWNNISNTTHDKLTGFSGDGDFVMTNFNDETVRFKPVVEEETNPIRKILLEVKDALEDKGYEPVNQLVGYLLSGDPTYITSHRNARNLIRRVERDEILEELVKAYVGDSKDN